MAKIKLRSYIKSIHGRSGDVIYYNVNGNQYVRSYTIPQNPGTVGQQKNREAFSDAVKEWQSLAPDKKTFYNHLAEGRSFSGYNLFISLRKRGITAEMLILIRSGFKREMLLFTYCQVPVTSVIYSSLYADYIISLRGLRQIQKKPPGTALIAA